MERRVDAARKIIKILSRISRKGFFKYMNKIISCIGSSYCQPIVDLYEKMQTYKYTGDCNNFQVSPRENGYAVSIIILTVLLIDSTINRIKYFEKKTARNNAFINNFFNNPELSHALEEAYIIRDVIAHNHLREIETHYNENTEKTTAINNTLLNSYGDKKFNKGIDKVTLQTKFCALNINPVIINKNDVEKIFKILHKFLISLKDKDRNYSQPLNESVKYNSKIIKLQTFLDNI